jgi:hypothetical protein
MIGGVDFIPLGEAPEGGASGNQRRRPGEFIVVH